MLSIEETRGLGDPQKSYKWNAILPSIGEKESPPIKRMKEFFSLEGDIRSTNSEQLINQATALINGNLKLNKTRLGKFNPSFYVEEVQGLPFPNVDREAFYEGGRNTYFAGIEDVSPFTITFFQDESGKIPKYIMDWKRLIILEDGTKNLPDIYKKTIRIQLLNGLNVPIYDIRLLGCFPTNTVPYNLANNTDRLQLIQEFSLDRYEIISISNQKFLQKNLEQRLKQRIPSELDDLADFSNDIF